MTEHALVLVETIFLAAPAERAGIIHAFSDPACLLWGAESPEEGEIVNATNRWRSYTLRLHTPPNAARRSKTLSYTHNFAGGAESPEEGEVVNATNRWRSYTLRLHTPPNAARRC